MIGSAISGVASSIAGVFQQKAALKAQQEQQEREQLFQRSMYSQSVNDNRENVASERSYNDPSNVRSRLRMADVNADLYYGGGASGLTSSHVASPGTTPNAPHYDPGQVIAGMPNVAQNFLQGIAAMRMFAETKNIEADTSKKKGEIDSLSLDNIRKAATQGSMIELDNFQINLAKSTLSLNQAQQDKLLSEIQNLRTQNDAINQSIAESMARVQNLDSVTLNNRIQAYLASPRFDMEVKSFQQSLRESDARIGLSNAQAKEILTLLMAKKLNISADTFFKQKSALLQAEKTYSEILNQDILSINARQLNFNYNQDTKFDTAQRIAVIANLGLSSVGDIIGTITKLGPVLKAASKVGFNKK